MKFGYSRLALTLCVFAFLGLQPESGRAAPTTVVIQGKLESGAGAALAGARQYRIRFFDASAAGSRVGPDFIGLATVADTGRFAITLSLGAAVLALEDVWYELSIDSAIPPKGAIDQSDTFGDRIKLHSVPFSRLSADSEALGGTAAADMATDAELTSGLASEAAARDAAIATEITARDAAIAAAVASLVSSPAVPAAPTELRLLPSLRGAPYRRLVWNIADFGGMANFIVYESNAPITSGNKAAAVRRFVSTTELELAIFSNAGMRFFRVAALNFFGDEGGLSNEFGLDTTARIAYRADQAVENIFEIYVAPAAGGSDPPVKVNGPFLIESDASSFAFSPDGARIAYVADEDIDDVPELYVAPAGGGGSSVKINSPLSVGEGVVSFAFSPDAMRIAFLSATNGGALLELYVAPVAGGSAPVKVNSELVSGGSLSFDAFAFSPDGTRIAYVADQESVDVRELYVAPATGGGSSVKVNSELVAGADVMAGFIFSPSGERIVYLADQESDGRRELFVAPAAGGGSSVKVNSPLVPGGRVFLSYAFSPDGSRIAYVADQEIQSKFELFVAPATGGGASVKVNTDFVSGGDVFEFVFSPDGSRIIYRADQEAQGVQELFVAPAGGGGTSVKVNLALGPGRDVTGGYLFAPDGSSIVYGADQDIDNKFEIYVAPPGGGGATVKVNSALISAGDVIGFTYSPDGSRIGYRADQDTNNVNELYVAPSSGGSLSKKINPTFPSGRTVTFFAFSPLGFTP